MNWKFRQQPRIPVAPIKSGRYGAHALPIETQTELIDLRAKVAEYAEKIDKLEKRHETTMQIWSRHARILLGLECPNPDCRADLIVWREQLHEEHHCPDAKIDAKMLCEIHFGGGK